MLKASEYLYDPTGHRDVGSARSRQQALFKMSEHLNMIVAPESF
jgi:hypothetical protein